MSLSTVNIGEKLADKDYFHWKQGYLQHSKDSFRHFFQEFRMWDCLISSPNLCNPAITHPRINTGYLFMGYQHMKFHHPSILGTGSSKVVEDIKKVWRMEGQAESNLRLKLFHRWGTKKG